LHFCLNDYIIANEADRKGRVAGIGVSTIDGTVSTARNWFAVAGLQASRPTGDKLASTFFLRWPQVGVLELGPSPEVATCARRHVVALLGEWDVPFGIKQDMELICSELMANALEATSSLPPLAVGEPWPVGLRLLGNRQRIVLEVWDCHPGVPVRQAAPDDQEGGRGLAIVHELANRWGSRRLSAHVKAVWAELLLPTSVAPHQAAG
jgi:anti-sigma regulatory factor (Ser/Thr protein kinase)